MIVKNTDFIANKDNLSAFVAIDFGILVSVQKQRWYIWDSFANDFIKDGATLKFWLFQKFPMISPWFPHDFPMIFIPIISRSSRLQFDEIPKEIEAVAEDLPKVGIFGNDPRTHYPRDRRGMISNGRLIG